MKASFLFVALLIGSVVCQPNGGGKPEDAGGQGRGNGTSASQGPPGGFNGPKGPNHGKVKIDDKGPNADMNVTDGVRVVAVGKKPQFRISPGTGNSSFQIRFGKVFEINSAGQPVAGHMVASMADEMQSFSYGGAKLGSLDNVTYVSMSLSLAAAKGFQLACPNGSALVNASLASLASSSIKVTMYLGIANATTVPYGAGNTLAIPADATKVNVESANWPFCGANNSLVVELEIQVNDKDAQPGQLGRKDPQMPPPANATTVASSALAQAMGNSSAGNSSRGRPEKRASFDLGNSIQAQVDLPTYAFDAVDGAVNYTVGVDLKVEGGKTKVALSFPAHTTLFYDPTTAFVDTSSSTSTDGTIVAYNSSGTTTTTTTTAKNSAAASGAAWSLWLAALGAALLSVAAL